MEAKIHSVETCGTVDGPGIRYVVFFQGCPMRCLYCHNPDTWLVDGGDMVELEVLFRDIMKYKNYMKFSGGGITASGGEPLLQAGFVSELFKLCRQNGIRTALDTSGSILNDKVNEILEYTDLVLLDIKCFDAERYEKLTSHQLKPTLKFAQCLAEHNIPVWLRYVLVPDLTDDIQEISSLADFACKLGNVERVDVLPFHKMGEYKWPMLGYDYKLTATQPPDNQMLTDVKKIFNDKGLFAV